MQLEWYELGVLIFLTVAYIIDIPLCVYHISKGGKKVTYTAGYYLIKGAFVSPVLALVFISILSKVW